MYFPTRAVPTPAEVGLTDAEPVTFLVPPGAGHNDDALLAGDQLIQEIVEFLQAAGVMGP